MKTYLILALIMGITLTGCRKVETSPEADKNWINYGYRLSCRVITLEHRKYAICNNFKGLSMVEVKPQAAGKEG